MSRGMKFDAELTAFHLAGKGEAADPNCDCMAVVKPANSSFKEVDMIQAKLKSKVDLGYVILFQTQVCNLKFCCAFSFSVGYTLLRALNYLT